MNSKYLVFKILFLTIFCLNISFANEINLEVNSELFKKMYGEEYDKVIASKSKLDDEKFALDLVANATAINSKPELQIYIKLKAAELLLDSDKNKKQARDLLIEVSPNLPELLKREIAQKTFDLQRKIMNATPKTNRATYAEEIEMFVSTAQSLSNYYLLDSDFSASLTILREALGYVITIDKFAGNELNKMIQGIQKESNRYSQILSLIDQLKINPKDEKINQSLSEYYLFERNNFFMAWPYLENTKNEVLKVFFNSLKLCLTDEKTMTLDGLSISLTPLIAAQPKYFLNWLSKSDLVDEAGELKKQIDLLNTNKKIQKDKVENILQNTVNNKGNKQEVSYHIFIGLASDISALIDMILQNKKLDNESSKLIVAQLTSNKYISLTKANIKLEETKPINEIDKLKMEVELNKVKNRMKELEIIEFTVDLSTPFLLQQNDLLLDKIAVNGGGVYTFEVNSWNQFNKDFEVMMDDKVFDHTDKKSMFIQDGVLVFNDKQTFQLNSKNRKWSSNFEFSFEIIKDQSQLDQGLDVYLTYKPNSDFNQLFRVMYSFIDSGGWVGVIKNEDWDEFISGKLAKCIDRNPQDSIWRTEKVKMTTIVKDNKLEISINEELICSFPFGEISKDKSYLNTAMQIQFVKRNGTNVPLKIDNLYIGPPRSVKK